jgi:general secretion pathway protein D
MLTKTWKLIIVCALGLCVAHNAWAQQRSSTRSSSGGSSRSSGTTREYQSNGMIGDAMISGDAETRRIIVITDDETAASISQVITNLDRPKPQVLIKVVFLEVTYSNGSDIGLDGSITKKLGGGVTGTAGSMFNQSALGTAGLPLGAGGLFSVFGNDWTATLRAIQQGGKAEVLSRPSIMARNNQQAVIIVGQRVPIITGSTTVSLTGNINNTISYESVGIILRVTPFISSDGMVEMIVAPEISSIAGEGGAAISSGTNSASIYSSPIINTRSAETVVVTPNKKTIVIGGLMENKKAKNVRKIPLLGDIPLLGAAFKRTVKEDVKTELVIFLTPEIILNPMDAAALTEHERNQGTMKPSFSEDEMNRFLDNLPVKPVQPVAEPEKKKSSSGNKGSSTPIGAKMNP